jgi:hypothetical protein
VSDDSATLKQILIVLRDLARQGACTQRYLESVLKRLEEIRDRLPE